MEINVEEYRKLRGEAFRNKFLLKHNLTLAEVKKLYFKYNMQKQWKPIYDEEI